jgi:nicotinamide phosphoribosyltransferase
MKDTNICLTTDAYKQFHTYQYPKDTKVVYSYLESRGGEFDYTLFFGLQYFLKEYLTAVVVTKEMVDEAQEFCKGVFGYDRFNRKGWERIINVHGGKLPVSIRAVPEGMKVPVKNVLMTLENTDEELPWVTNFLETLLLQVWYPTTVATLSANIKDVIGKYATVTSEVGVSPFHLNDFGARGCSSQETAGIGGAAHLVNFLGTDTLRGIVTAMKYYNQPTVCGHSVMATEHSTTTIYGKENELEAYTRFLDECPTGILSVVSDSYNIYNAIEMFGTTLKERILNRDSKFVVRPDSGDPIKMSVEVLELLWKYFGGTVNNKGFRVLNPKVGMIYGDGINLHSIEQILEAVTDHEFSTDNIVFGCGGALLQQVNRDTCKFAFKCCAAKRGNEWVEVYKDPITDPDKVSKKGKLKLVRDGNTVKTVGINELGEDLLQTVFENGILLKDYTFEEVRNNVNL